MLQQAGRVSTDQMHHRRRVTGLFSCLGAPLPLCLKSCIDGGLGPTNGSEWVAGPGQQSISTITTYYRHQAEERAHRGNTYT